MKTLYLVDFDGTLFNSNKLHQDINSFLENLGITKLQLKDAYEETKKDGKPFNIQKYLELLELDNILQVKKRIEQHIIDVNNNYLYPDTLEFLEKFNQPIIIYTFANSNFYKFKLKISKLNKLKLKSIIVDGKKDEYLKQNLIYKNNKVGFSFSALYDKICWVDDKVDGFIRIKIKNVEFIRLKREGDKYALENTPENVKEIGSLLELISNKDLVDF